MAHRDIFLIETRGDNKPISALTAVPGTDRPRLPGRLPPARCSIIQPKPHPIEKPFPREKTAACRPRVTQTYVRPFHPSRRLLFCWQSCRRALSVCSRATNFPPCALGRRDRPARRTWLGDLRSPCPTVPPTSDGQAPCYSSSLRKASGFWPCCVGAGSAQLTHEGRLCLGFTPCQVKVATSPLGRLDASSGGYIKAPAMPERVSSPSSHRTDHYPQAREQARARCSMVGNKIGVQPPKRTQAGTYLYPPVIAKQTARPSSPSVDYFATVTVLDRRGTVLDGYLQGTKAASRYQVACSKTDTESFVFPFTDLSISYPGTYVIRVDIFEFLPGDYAGAALVEQLDTRAVCVSNSQVSAESPCKKRQCGRRADQRHADHPSSLRRAFPDAQGP